MPVPMSSDELLFQGPIALEHALFCLDCEVIFTDLARCPSCNGTVVWPLARWLAPAQPDLAAEPMPGGWPAASDDRVEDSRAVA
jgi:hypothetical protein